MKTKHCIVEDLDTVYHHKGSGKKAVVFLHGWMSSAKTFDKIAATLPKEVSYFGLELPGFGSTEAPKADWGVEEYVSFITKWQGKIGLTKVDTYIGHSMGGRILLQAIGRNKLVASRLVLIGSHGVAGDQSLRLGLYKLAAKTGKVLTFWLPRSIRSRLQSRLYSSAGAGDYLEADGMREVFKSVISTDARGDAAQITLPTLLIYGKNDVQTPPEFGKIFNNLIKSSEFLLVDAAGHYTYIDQPHTVSKAINNFVGDRS